MDNLGKKLKKLRLLKKLTLVELAKMSGVGKSTISDIENGKINPSVNTIEKLTNSMQVDSSVLFNSNEKIKTEHLKVNEKIKEQEIDSFTVKLVNELLKENIIQDPDNIPDEIVKMIILNLKKDIKKRSGD